MTSLIEDVLAAWRDAERVLEELPELSVDHETVARVIAQLRETYSELTAASADSRTRIRASRASLERSRQTLERARARLDRSGAAGSEPASPGDPATDA